MIRFLFICILVSSINVGAVSRVVTFQGEGFSNEIEFSKYLKSKYDLLEYSFKQEESGNISLEARVFDPPEKLKLNFKNPYKPSRGFFNKNNIWKFNLGVPLTFVAYGGFFWDWGKIKSFNFRDEGWFGSGTYAGGTDKLAHFYSHYLISRSSYYFYRTSGVSHEKALWSSTILASGIGLLIEIGDGLSHYGFSYQDLISDLLGIGLGHLLNSNAYLNELIGFQLYWKPSSDKGHRGMKFRDPVDDYNNQKYILNFRLAAVPIIRDIPLLRYINLDLGYYSRGFKDSNPGSPLVREIYTGASLNISQILRDAFPNSDFAYHSSKVFRYYQPPATGFEAQTWEDRD